MIYLVAASLVYFLYVLLKLNWYATGALFIFALFVVPLHQRRIQRGQKQKERFYEVSLYLDTILYSFVKEEKIEAAIYDVAQTLPQGPLKKLTEQVYEYLQMTYEQSEILEEALDMIYKNYPCKRVKDVHQFMCHVEYYGGEIERPVSLLLADKSRWEQRIKMDMEHRKRKLIDVILSAMTSLFICGAILYLPVRNIDISQEAFVQVCSLLVVIANDVFVLSALKYLEVDWLNLPATEEEDYYVKKMNAFLNYDEKKERRYSVWLGCIGAVFCIFSFVWFNEWVTAGLLFFTVFLFFQHRAGKFILRKSLIKKIKYDFPNWLLDIVLLLQSENVYMALEKSKAHVPGVLKKDLNTLLESLEMEPEASEPYHRFLQEFSIPEVDSAMGILYSLSIGNSANADRQISELVEKNLELLDKEESKILESASSGMYVLFLLPVITASFKLIVDMMFLMLQFIQIPAF